MKYLVINTEAFSVAGMKGRMAEDGETKISAKALTLADLPWVVRAFLSAFKRVFVVLDESSYIKTTVPMRETAKSTRSRMIKLFNQTDTDRCIMSGTMASKSPLNYYDQFDFLQAGYFPEGMYAMAEKYCVMETIRVGKGGRVLISQKHYEEIRKRLVKAWNYGVERKCPEFHLEVEQARVYAAYKVDYTHQEHIMAHPEYTPFMRQADLRKRIAPDTMFVRREDVFDITFDRFVKEPIKRPIRLSGQALGVAKELVDLGFTDTFTLGQAAALELMLRLQDVCNGFEPVSRKNADGARTITYKPFKENPKVDAVMSLLDEIDVEENQVVVWSSRRNLLEALAAAFTKAGITYTRYDGSASDKEKTEAEIAFKSGAARIFLANQASGAFGLNCLADCSYAVYCCVDGSVEKYHQSQHRILRGALKAPKFAYAIYAEGSVEERQWQALRVGQELIQADNRRDTFEFV